jgi:CRISPR system Cascade subunit CasD
VSVLLLRLAGPMQSWGVLSRFGHRDTGTEPSKSGVVGMLCAALGVPRDDDATVAELSACPMGVRVLREGTLCADFHTVGAGIVPGRPYGVARADGSPGGVLLSAREYLAEADFVVALQSDDAALLDRLDRALRQPVWPLFLGRRSYVPAVPPALGIEPGMMAEVLRGSPAIPACRNEVGEPIRLVLEAPFGVGDPRLDVPVSFHPDRRAFRLRYVETHWIEE